MAKKNSKVQIPEKLIEKIVGKCTLCGADWVIVKARKLVLKDYCEGGCWNFQTQEFEIIGDKKKWEKAV